MLKITSENELTIIQLNRPEVRNAVDGTTARELAEAFRQFDEDEKAKVAILYGEGSFCAGADLKAISRTDGSANRVTEDGDGPMGPTRMLLRKPVIAAIEGYAVAGGLELAAWCDMRVADRNAKFGVFCRRFGVPLVDGGTIRLPRLIGMSRAMDMILTGREVDAEEAYAMGLVNRLVAPGEALSSAKALAESICKHPQLCMRMDRLSAYQQSSLSLEDALVNETRLGLEAIMAGETLQGAQSFSKGSGRHGEFN